MIELHNVDCMEYLASLDDNAFELAIVDPPYGGDDAIGIKNNKIGKKQATKRTDYKVFENVEPTKEYFKELYKSWKDSVKKPDINESRDTFIINDDGLVVMPFSNINGVGNAAVENIFPLGVADAKFKPN